MSTPAPTPPQPRDAEQRWADLGEAIDAHDLEFLRDNPDWHKKRGGKGRAK